MVVCTWCGWVAGQERRGGLSPGPFGCESAARTQNKTSDGALDIISHCLLHKASDSAGVESDVFRTGVGRFAKTSDSILAESDDISNEQIQKKTWLPPNPTYRRNVFHIPSSCRFSHNVAPARQTRRVSRVWVCPNDRGKDIVPTSSTQ